MDELKLINRAREGDADAFCSLYGLYKDRLFRYAFYRLQNCADAEDAVSDCVLSAWKQIGSLRSPEAFSVWLFRILSASCAARIRQQIITREQVSLDDPGSGGYESATLLSAENAAAAAPDEALALSDALTRLAEEERNIVLFSLVAGLSSPEIAEITGLSAGSVRSKLSRSLKKLRGYYE